MTWDERWFRAFGSDAHVIVGGSAELTAWVIDEAERLEQCWSRFRDDAELVQLNRSDHVTVQVSALMIDIAERAHDAWRLTGGLFDPTTIGALERAAFVQQLPHDRDCQVRPPRCEAGSGVMLERFADPPQGVDTG